MTFTNLVLEMVGQQAINLRVRLDFLETLTNDSHIKKYYKDNNEELVNVLKKERQQTKDEFEKCMKILHFLEEMKDE